MSNFVEIKDKIFSVISIIIAKVFYAWVILAIYVIFLTLLPLPTLGSMEEVKNANPKHQFEDGNFQKLVEENYKYTSYDQERYDIWNLSSYQSECEIFSPNWKKVNNCISTYKLCEVYLPLGKYNKEGNHDPEFSNKFSYALDVYFDAKNNNPEKYPEYVQCIDSSTTKWTTREYGILALKIFYIVPVLIVAVPIEFIFGNGSSHFIVGSLDF